MQLIGSVICGFFIYWLFRLVREPEAKTSKAIWIPVVWLFIVGSRPASVWLTGDYEGGQLGTYYNGSTLDAIVYQILLGLGLVVLVRRKAAVTAILRNNWPIVLFFAYCLVSAYWSNNSFLSAKRWLKGVGDLVVVLIMLTEQDPLTAVKRVITRTGFFLLPLSVLFIYAIPDLGIAPGSQLTVPMINGVTTGKNELGRTCMIWGIGFLWCFFDSFRKRTDPRGKVGLSAALAYAILYGMSIWLVVTCNSATSLSCLLLGTALMVATNLRWISKRPLFVHCCFFGVLSIAYVAVFVAPRLLSSVGRSSTLTGRTDVWNSVLTMVGNPLIGTGYEGFWVGWRLTRMWNIYWWHPIEAHEGYLDIYLSLGWIGIALLTAVLLRGYGAVVAGLRRGTAMGSLKVTYIAAALIYNLSESAFHYVCSVWILLLLATTVPAAIFTATDHPSPPVKLPDVEPENEWSPLWLDPAVAREP